MVASDRRIKSYTPTRTERGLASLRGCEVAVDWGVRPTDSEDAMLHVFGLRNKWLQRQCSLV